MEALITLSPVLGAEERREAASLAPLCAAVYADDEAWNEARQACDLLEAMSVEDAKEGGAERLRRWVAARQTQCREAKEAEAEKMCRLLIAEVCGDV